METILYISLGLNALLIVGMLWNQHLLTREIALGRESLLAKSLAELRSTQEKVAVPRVIETSSEENHEMAGQYDPSFVPDGFNLEDIR